MVQSRAISIAIGLSIIATVALMTAISSLSRHSKTTESPRDYYKGGIHYLVFKSTNSIFVVNYTMDSIELKIQKDYGDK